MPIDVLTPWMLVIPFLGGLKSIAFAYSFCLASLVDLPEYRGIVSRQIVSRHIQSGSLG